MHVQRLHLIGAANFAFAATLAVTWTGAVGYQGTPASPPNAPPKSAVDTGSAALGGMNHAAQLACPWDFDGNGGVDFQDLLKVLANWGPCPPICPWDFDGNGGVDFQDLLKLLANWGSCPPEDLLDAFETVNPLIAPSSFDFGLADQPPIPPDFFGPGSDPFLGPLLLEGQPLDFGATGTTDTVVRRLAPFIDPIAPQDVPIEIVELSLQSVAPIIVTTNGGQNPELWMVNVALSEQPAGPGEIQVTPTSPNGGFFGAEVPVNPHFFFTNLQDIQLAIDGLIQPEDIRIVEIDWPDFSSGPLLLQWEFEQPFVRQVCPDYIAQNGLFVFPGSNGPLGFVPGIVDKDGGGCFGLFKPGPMPHVKPAEAHYVAPPNANPGGGPGLRCEYVYSGVSVARGACLACPPAPPTVKGPPCVVDPDCKPFLLRIVPCAGAGFCVQVYFMPTCQPC